MEDNNKSYNNNDNYMGNEEREDEIRGENTRLYASIPTAVIVVLCILVWPIGLILLVLKFSSKNSIEAQTYKRLNVTQNDIANTTNLNILRGRKTSAIVGAVIAFIFGVLFFIVAFDQILFGGNITKAIYEREYSNVTTSKNQIQYSENETNTEEKMKNEVEQYKYLYLTVGGALAAVFFLLGISKWIKAFAIGNKIQKIEIYQNLILIREIFSVNELSSYLRTSPKKVLDNTADMIREGYLCGIRIKQDQIERIPEYIDPNRIVNVKCPHCGANNKYTKGKENKCEYCGTVLDLNKF